MSLNRFVNSNIILQNNSTVVGQVLTNRDLNSIAYDSAILDSAILDTIRVESHIYNKQGQYLVSEYHTPFSYSYKYKDFTFNLPSLFDRFRYSTGVYKVNYNFLVDLLGTIETLPLFVEQISPDGTELKLRVKESYKVFDPDIETKFNLFREIAGSLKASDSLNNLVVNFGQNRLYKVVNLKAACEDPDPDCRFARGGCTDKLVIYVKLYSSVEADVEETSSCFMCYGLLESYVDTFVLRAGEQPNEPTKLKGPNFDSDGEGKASDIKYWNSLLDADANTTSQIIREVISGSQQIPLNVDFTSFGNFVVYGSATERLKNYKYKLELLEYYDSQKSTLQQTSSTGSAVIQEATSTYELRKQRLLDSFDPFEKYLYNETGSIFTHDINGGVLPTPKFISQSNYYNYATTSSVFLNWYDPLLQQAEEFDRTNYSSLYYNTPDHILRDPNNSQYVLFINMIGQHFDNLYNYVNKLTSIHERDEHPQRGIPNKLLPHYARSLGWKLQNNKQLSDLWLYKLGTDASGSYSDVSGPLLSKPHEELSEQIWRRVVNNLPFLLKTKGTKRSIRSLFSIYGIPFTLISVKEYGGPAIDSEKPDLIQDRFSYVLNFEGDQYLETQRKYVSSSKSQTLDSGPHFPATTTQFRFKTTYTGSVSMSLFGVENPQDRSDVVQELQLIHSSAYGTSSLYGSTNYGKLIYTIKSGSSYKSGSTDLLPLFDGDMWTVRIAFDPAAFNYTRMETPLPLNSGLLKVATIDVAKASNYVDSRVSISDRITIQDTWSSYYDQAYDDAVGKNNPLSLPDFGQYAIIGGTTGSGLSRFSGSIHGYQEHAKSLDNYNATGPGLDTEVFYEHVLNPGAYYGTSYSSSYNDMTRYYPLGLDNIKYDHTSQLIISSSHPLQEFLDRTYATFYGFTGNDTTQYSPLSETYYTYQPNIGANIPRSSKVALEQSTLVRGLQPDSRSELSQYDLKRKDTNKVAVVFSPTDQINRDISNQFGPESFDNLIGDPQYAAYDTYPELEVARNEYFKKYETANDIGKYIEIFSLYDFEVFQQLKQLVPARANLVSGILVEPTIVERPKVKRQQPELRYTTNIGSTLDASKKEITGSNIPILQTVLNDIVDLEFDRSKLETDLAQTTEIILQRSKELATASISPSTVIERNKYTSEEEMPPEVLFQRNKYTSEEEMPPEVLFQRNKYTSEEEMPPELAFQRNKYTSQEEMPPELEVTRHKNTSTLHVPSLEFDTLLTRVLYPNYNDNGTTIQLLGEVSVYQNNLTSNYVAVKDSNNNVVRLISEVPLYQDNVTGQYVGIRDGNDVVRLEATPTENTREQLYDFYNRSYTNSSTLGQFKVFKDNSEVAFDNTQKQDSDYIFHITASFLDSEVAISGPSFREFINKYNIQTYNDLNVLYKNLTNKGTLPTIYITGSRATPGYSITKHYYSSSGEYITGETSPNMLLSPVYLQSRTGSNKTDYDRELDYAINKSYNAFYSSSEDSVNYQYFQDSSIMSSRIEGTKLTGPGINQPSNNTLNNDPVVTVTLLDDRDIIVE